MDITALRDLSLGAVAIVAMAWVLVQIMKWQLEERRTWTAKVEDWGKSRNEDKEALREVLEKTATAMQKLSDTIAEDEKARESSALAIARLVQALTTDLRAHRRVTEEKGHVQT